MDQPDLYAILGVARDADRHVIKQAYRKLALRYHPDKHHGDVRADRFLRGINHAYNVLSDAHRRALYDEFGAAALRANFDPERARRAAAAARYSHARDPFDGPTWAESNAQARAYESGYVHVEPPEDSPREVVIAFADAVRGAEVPLVLHGARVTVRVPPGATDGRRVRIPARDGTPRDVVVTLRVRPHPRFWLEDGDLHARVPITVSEACRGARVRVPTPCGAVMVAVPPRAGHSARLRVRGKGVPASGDTPATDLIVRLELVLPDAESEAAWAALAALDGHYTRDPREDFDDPW